MLELKQAAIDERRKATRFPKEAGMEFAAIWHPQDVETVVEVFDESLGGLGVLVDDPSAFQIGLDIELVYAGSLMAGSVRHIRPHGDGRFLMGLRCTPIACEEYRESNRADTSINGDS